MHNGQSKKGGVTSVLFHTVLPIGNVRGDGQTPPVARSGGMTTEKVGDRVRRYRRLLGMTQPALAAAANTDKGYIGRLEAGRIGQPSIDVLERLASALHRPVEDLADPRFYTVPKGGTVETMDAIERAILDDPDLDDEQKRGLMLSARMLVGPYVEAARRRKRPHASSPRSPKTRGVKPSDDVSVPNGEVLIG